ncbi:MAG TPA: hypothetical protein VID48_08575 [Solirubrobacteraceae bacterium]
MLPLDGLIGPVAEPLGVFIRLRALANNVPPSCEDGAWPAPIGNEPRKLPSNIL